jgi:hypothetical protein
MPEEPTEGPQEQPQERHQFMSPQTRNLLVGTAIAVILLTVTAWAGSVRTEKARRTALGNGVAALAASLKYPMLEANSMRTNAGRERLRPIVVEIAKAGDYAAVYIVEPDGDVIATTKGELAAERVSKDDLPSKGTKIRKTSTALVVGSPIMLADNVLGYVFVETKPD